MAENHGSQADLSLLERDTSQSLTRHPGRSSNLRRQDCQGLQGKRIEKRCADVASRAESTWHDAEVLVVTLVEASNLIVRDFIMKKSDPFCKLKLGKLSRKSSVKSGNLNPIWNEVRSWKCLIPRRVI
jgi:hypothetical protein